MEKSITLESTKGNYRLVLGKPGDYADEEFDPLDKPCLILMNEVKTTEAEKKETGEEYVEQWENMINLTDEQYSEFEEMFDNINNEEEEDGE